MSSDDDGADDEIQQQQQEQEAELRDQNKQIQLKKLQATKRALPSDDGTTSGTSPISILTGQDETLGSPQ